MATIGLESQHIWSKFKDFRGVYLVKFKDFQLPLPVFKGFRGLYLV